MDIYVISKDQPEQQKVLHDDLEKVFDRSIPFLSDPERVSSNGDDQDKNNEEDVAYRGYVIIDQDGNVILKKKNDYWGQELDQTVKDVKEAIKK